MVLNGLDTKQSAATDLHLHQHDSVLDVDDIVTSNVTKQTQGSEQQHGSKLAHAKEVNTKTVTELQSLCKGLDEKISEIGIVVAEAQKYQGVEKLYSGLGHIGIKWGKDRAAVLRHQRIDKLSLKQAVQEIQNYTVETIKQLGESEQEYKIDLQAYQTTLTETLKKQSNATPPYLTAQANRAELEGKVQAAKEELDAGTIDQAERPHKEEQLELLQRQLHDAQLQETSYLSTVKEAKEAIPTLQKDRDAAAKAIQALHGMRQSMFEKFNNLKVVLERATTAMKSNSRLELYSNVDASFNKTIEAVTANNIASSGAALEVWGERMKHAAIDPQKSQELLQELLGHIADYAKDMQSIEDGVKDTGKPSTPQE